MTAPACRVIQGDVLTVLPTLPDASVDAVITDPPYSSGAATLAGKQAPVAKKYQNTGTLKTYPVFYGDQRDQRSLTYWITLWLAQCWRIARDKAPLLVFTDWRQLPAFTDAVQAAGWAWRGVVVWRKPGARPVLGEFRREAEFIVYARKGGYAGKIRRPLPARGVQLPRGGGQKAAHDREAPAAHVRPHADCSGWGHGAGPVLRLRHHPGRRHDFRARGHWCGAFGGVLPHHRKQAGRHCGGAGAGIAGRPAHGCGG